MQKLHNKGFTVVEVLLLVVLVALVAGIGYYIYTQSQKQDETSKPQSSVSQPSNSHQDTPKSENVTYLADNQQIILVKPGDESKLPDDIPASFKAFMKEKLSKNSKPDKYGCYTLYSVEKYSALNISGGTGAVNDLSGEWEAGSCGGGAAAFWYLKNGEWGEHVTQAINTCDDIAKTTIYEEFIRSCLKGNGEDMNAIVKNPNGSIDDALDEE